MRITAPTRGGTIAVAPGSGDCTGCGAPAPLEVEVAGQGSGGTVPICGDCLAEGLAIMLGRRHVQAGGRVEDLAAEPPPA